VEGAKLKELNTGGVGQSLRQDIESAARDFPSEPRRQRSQLPPPRSISGRRLPALTHAEMQAILDEEDARRLMRVAGIPADTGESAEPAESD
jgi:hypothetical protein